MATDRTGFFRSRIDWVLAGIALIAVVVSFSAFYLRNLADDQTRLHGWGRTWIFHPGEVVVRTTDDRISRHDLPTHENWVPIFCIGYLGVWLGRNLWIMVNRQNARKGIGARGFPMDSPASPSKRGD